MLRFFGREVALGPTAPSIGAACRSEAFTDRTESLFE
jgi:hypothetical protein